MLFSQHSLEGSISCYSWNYQTV